MLAQGPDAGALPTLLAAVSDIPGGSFVGPSRFGGVRGPATVGEISPVAEDPDSAARLWRASEHLTGTRFPFTSASPSPAPTTDVFGA
ncbi:hypothetical protein [Nocardia ignorata]|uniref:Short subunit dehydrogenase n=1 Tax=Nocardia ignorata TaxID=145285 RepID=A0A4R6PJ98_NOCIG|nr:hypothetical protein [Nocardia ignorata]TDP38131.1 hypothetical protein DFR75_104485 [Nocardia ignorata]